MIGEQICYKTSYHWTFLVENIKKNNISDSNYRNTCYCFNLLKSSGMPRCFVNSKHGEAT